MKLRIKSMIWNIRKQSISDQIKNPKEYKKFFPKKKKESTPPPKKKKQPHKDSVNNLWDNFEYSNIPIIGLPEEEKVQEIGNLFEKI